MSGTHGITEAKRHLSQAEQQLNEVPRFAYNLLSAAALY
jgi:hypothetical protein